MPVSIARLLAAAVAFTAWAGLAIQFNATFAQTGSVSETILILLRFFTVITNVLVATTMTVIAAGRRVPDVWLGGVTLAILLVGVVYFTLLRGLIELSGGALLADTLLHMVVPAIAALHWLLFARHGGLRWRDPWWWALYPLAYLGYALVRGAAEHRYPYPFIDVAKIGAAQTAINTMMIAVAFLVGGLALVWLDRALAVRRKRPDIVPKRES